MWSTIFNWLLGIIAKLGEFAGWLFERHSFADAVKAQTQFVYEAVTNKNPSAFQTIWQTIVGFFEEKTPSLLDWAENMAFRPIDIIGVAGLTLVVIMSFIKLFSIFA